MILIFNQAIAMSAKANDFYGLLPVSRVSMGSLLLKNELFSPVPTDWHVIITDIKNSTEAVMQGSHKEVNLVATGSIVAVLNVAFKTDVSVPFFFGGDGATFLVPPAIIDKVMQALALYKQNTFDNFNFELRTGTVAVEDIYLKGHQLHIARFGSSATFSIPIVLGNGLNYAEQLIKGNDYLAPDHPPQQQELDMEGMQCRWDRIPPPKDKEEVVTLLIIAQDMKMQPSIFSKVMNKLDELYGSPQKRQPISVARLKLRSTFRQLGKEMKAKMKTVRPLRLLINWITTLLGYFYFRTKRGKDYLKSLVEMSDTLVIDGKINTVITGSVKQREALQLFLDELEAKGEVLYGLHVSKASVMSCYVRDMKDDHIHFVDGSEGGYTQAARMLKAKLKR